MYRKWIRKSAIVLFWLLVWEAASRLVANDILLVGPLEVLQALFKQSMLPDFWKTVLLSSLRIGLGMVISFAAALCLGCLAFWKTFFRELLEPVVLLMKSVPVASFVVLLLIWAGSGNLSVWVTALVVFPMVYQSTVSGLESAPGQLLEMAEVFHISRFRRAVMIYRPALLPYLLSSCRVAAGMAWKSGVAAEVIGQPDFTIGNALYMAKIYLSTGDLLAWTVVIILLSILFEKLALLGLRRAGRDCLLPERRPND